MLEGPVESRSVFEAHKQSLKTQVLLESFHSIDYLVSSHAIDVRTSNGYPDCDDESGAATPGLEALAENVFEKLRKSDTLIDPGENFLSGRSKIESSDLFKVLSHMPKGALLHTHGIATGPFESLLAALKSDERVFVFRGDDSPDYLDGEIRFLSKNQADATSGWVPLREVPDRELLDKITMPSDCPRKDTWTIFQKIWTRLADLSNSLPVWSGRNSYFWCMLTDLFKSGVTYVEIKHLIPKAWVSPSADGQSVDRSVPIDAFMQVFHDTVSEFKAEHPEFVGAKMVWCTLKLFGPEVVDQDTITVLRLMRAFPGLVAGYDLVGHEDTLHPISLFAPSLARFRAQGGRLLLHAGETVEPDADQIYDAVSVGSQRIGHAYALPKFPALMRLVKDRGITVECCPISNQVLGYVHDLRNHPGLIMMNNGVRLTISSDDAAIFGYADLSFDFALVTKAWGLTLSQVRHLARASFKCTALSFEEQIAAEHAFDASWKRFLERLVLQYPPSKR